MINLFVVVYFFVHVSVFVYGFVHVFVFACVSVFVYVFVNVSIFAFLYASVFVSVFASNESSDLPDLASRLAANSHLYPFDHYAPGVGGLVQQPLQSVSD